MDLPAGLDYNTFRARVKGRYNRNKLSAAWKAYKAARTYESVVPRKKGAVKKSTPPKASPKKTDQHTAVRSKLATALAQSRAKKAAKTSPKPARSIDVDAETYRFWSTNEPEGLTSPFSAPEPHTWYTVKITGPAVVTLREPVRLEDGGGYVKLSDKDVDTIRGQIKNALYEVLVPGGHTVLQSDERDVFLNLDRQIPQKNDAELVELSVTPLYTPESASGRIVWAIREWLSHYTYVAPDGRKMRIG